MYNDKTISRQKKIFGGVSSYVLRVSGQMPVNEWSEIIKTMQFSELPLIKLFEREVRGQFVTYNLPWRRNWTLNKKATFYKHEMPNES